VFATVRAFDVEVGFVSKVRFDGVIERQLVLRMALSFPFINKGTFNRIRTTTSEVAIIINDID
jgi:hypothetical protein